MSRGECFVRTANYIDWIRLANQMGLKGQEITMIDFYADIKTEVTFAPDCADVMGFQYKMEAHKADYREDV